MGSGGSYQMVSQSEDQGNTCVSSDQWIVLGWTVMGFLTDQIR